MNALDSNSEGENNQWPADMAETVVSLSQCTMVKSRLLREQLAGHRVSEVQVIVWETQQSDQE
jgi:hypothetical protein